MLIGAHVSTYGGIVNAIHNAVSLGINVIQIFGSSPVRWKASMLSKKDSEKFIEERKRNGIERVYLHAPYLINLASEKPSTRHLSRILLKDTLRISNEIQADGVIYHTGSAGKQDSKMALDIAVESINRILDEVPEGNLIVENSAGAGALIGDSIDEIASMIKKVNSKRFGVCLDTCHGLASGIIKSFSLNGISEFEKEIKNKIGDEKIFAFHINDSKFPFDSKKDRHENLGEGYIGIEGFKNLFSKSFFKKKPLILEVPGFDGNGPDKKNIDILKNIIS